MKMTRELWIKGSLEHINEIRYILNCMLIIHELPPPPLPPAVGRSPLLSGGAGAAAEHAFVQPPPPPPSPPACERCGAPTAPRLGVCAGCELYVAISETLRTADRRADWRHGIQEALHNYRARTRITDERGDPVLLAPTSTARDEASLDELPLFLDACHSCALRKVRISDDGSDFSEGYLQKRRRAYYALYAGRIPARQNCHYGLNELGGQECSLCGPDGVYRGSACSRSMTSTASGEASLDELRCYRARLQTSRLRMQTASTSCRVLELVAQHGWVPEEQIKLLNNSLSRIEILTRYVRAVDDNADSAVDDNADSATAHCWHDGFWIDSDGHWRSTDSPAFGDAGYWSD